MFDVAYSMLLDQATARDQLVQAGGGEPAHVEQLHSGLGLMLGGLPPPDDDEEDDDDPSASLVSADLVEQTGISRGDLAQIIQLKGFTDMANEVIH